LLSIRNFPYSKKKARVTFDTSMKNEFYNPLTKLTHYSKMQYVCQKNIYHIIFYFYLKINFDGNFCERYFFSKNNLSLFKIILKAILA
jgi:hypothetical protein